MSSQHKLVGVVVPLGSAVPDSLRPPWTVACQAPLVHGIFQARTLEWVAIFLLQGIFLTQGSKPRLLLGQVDSLPQAPPRKLRSRGAGSPSRGCSLRRYFFSFSLKAFFVVWELNSLGAGYLSTGLVHWPYPLIIANRLGR